jgi:hypothetical protein
MILLLIYYRLAVKLKKENCLNFKPDITVMKSFASIVNSKPLPALPTNSNSGPTLLLPSNDNSLLKNNFHIYSDTITQKLNNKKNKMNVILKPTSSDRMKIHKGISLSKKRIRQTITNADNKNKYTDITENTAFKDVEVDESENQHNYKDNYDHHQNDEDGSSSKAGLDLKLADDDNYDDVII